MEIEQIQRSRLYRESYLPGGIIRLRNHANARVVGARNNDIAVDSIDKEQLFETAKRFISTWENSGGDVDAGLNESVESGKMVVQSPSEVFLSPFPLLLSCNACKVIDFYEGRNSESRTRNLIVKRIRTMKGRPFVSCKRPGCPGHMHQLSYVAVHRCGNLDTINIPYNVRRIQNIGFNDDGGAFFFNSFFDVDTGERLSTALQDDCQNCSKQFDGRQETNKRGTPITSGDSFYPQTVQYIALSKKVGGLVSQLQSQITSTNGTLVGLTTDIAEGIASGLLGTIDSKTLEKQFRSLLDSEAPSDDKLAEVKAELERKIKVRDKYQAAANDDPEIAELVDGTIRRISELQQKLDQASGQFTRIRQTLSDDITLAAIVSQRRAIEAVMLRHDVQLVTVQESFDSIPDVVTRESKLRELGLLKKQYGIDQIGHIPDLLVVLSTIGFTRERRGPNQDQSITPVRLNGFEDSNEISLRGKYLFYAMSAKTEALLIRLDPMKVLNWCVQNGWEDPGELIKRDPKLSHAYLLTHSPALTLSPGEVSKQTRGRPPRENAPFHLLHSICHSLMATARRHTGYDTNSLMEYLLPCDLSFLVYVTSVQNYTSGGLLSLFKHYLQLWFDDASIYAFNCAFDPICSDGGASCSGCLQTVIGCETFNHDISRAYLHGGNIDREQSFTILNGYWNAQP